MYIDIYSDASYQFMAVEKGKPIPESWTGAKFFKTINLLPGQVRIGMSDATEVLAAIEKDGFAYLGRFWGT